MSENKPSPPGAPSDPLASLHRMSTTAGIASQEYVAINLAAVAAFVLGLSSAMVLMGNVLLIIPAAAAVFAVVALKHIAASNGTQTGRGLALVGLAAALGFAAFVGGREYRAYTARQVELADIDKLVDEFGRKLVTQDFAGSLALFSDSFMSRKQLTPQMYTTVMQRVSMSPVYGEVKGVKTSGRVVLGEFRGSATGEAATMLLFSFPQVERPLRVEALFRKTNGQWKIDDISQFFPTPSSPEPVKPISPPPPR